LRIWAKVIFTGRAVIAHDSAGRDGAQIINPLGHGTAALLVVVSKQAAN
jgi:hypothetical protein